MYEVLDYPITQDEEVGSIPYWFSGMPEVVKSYRTKQSAIKYAKAYVQRVKRGIEVSFESADTSHAVEIFHKYFYPEEL